LLTLVRVPGYRSRGQGSIPGATSFSKKCWVRNEVHSASRVQLRSYLEEIVAASIWKTENTAIRIRHADHSTPSITATEFSFLFSDVWSVLQSSCASVCRIGTCWWGYWRDFRRMCISAVQTGMIIPLAWNCRKTQADTLLNVLSEMYFFLSHFWATQARSCALNWATRNEIVWRSRGVAPCTLAEWIFVALTL
jgi:hypothetical protein